ncbi:HAD-IA family hydrolase [Lederbergia citri]|uniref:HAD-IA family hydrolase n=1 Tax=Lederbergia citri TaxID=2833580 RepID=UPI002D7FB152|nr:HAD-IA family hydrolase [Lederbergia citri]
MKRLKTSGQYDYFEDIFVSQSIGFQKPSPKFFDYVMNHNKGFNKREVLIIGNSLRSDIKVGILSGIDTCWINRAQQKNCQTFKVHTRL